jgi:hypothetical protein
MNLVKLKSTKGSEIYVRPEHFAVVSPSSLVGQCSITLPFGVSIEIDESARNVAQKLGFSESLSE